MPQRFYLLDILVYVNSVKINFGHLACIVQCLLYLLFVGGRPGYSLGFFISQVAGAKLLNITDVTIIIIIISSCIFS